MQMVFISLVLGFEHVNKDLYFSFVSKGKKPIITGKLGNIANFLFHIFLLCLKQ